MFVIVWWARMFRYIGLQATTTTPSYMICQSYWKLYHWQAEHERGTCMLELFSVTHIMPDG
jgi:hypothetical protein